MAILIHYFDDKTYFPNVRVLFFQAVKNPKDLENEIKGKFINNRENNTNGNLSEWFIHDIHEIMNFIWSKSSNDRANKSEKDLFHENPLIDPRTGKDIDNVTCRSLIKKYGPMDSDNKFMIFNKFPNINVDNGEEITDKGVFCMFVEKYGLPGPRNFIISYGIDISLYNNDVDIWKEFYETTYTFQTKKYLQLYCNKLEQTTCHKYPELNDSSNNKHPETNNRIKSIETYSELNRNIPLYPNLNTLKKCGYIMANGQACERDAIGLNCRGHQQRCQHIIITGDRRGEICGNRASLMIENMPVCGQHKRNK